MTEQQTSDRVPATRPAYAEIHPYLPDPDPVQLDLGDNTNRWGAPPAAVREMRSADPNSAARYPNAYAETLKTALARYCGVEESMIATGCGSDEILDCAMRAFGEPGDEVLGIAPSFVMVPTFARLNGLRYTPVPLRADYSIDAERFIESDAKIRYLCSPNNPTGGLMDRATIEAIVETARGIVIVDEAYMEFAGTTAADLVERHPRLVIARTLSKAWGLAGLRIGYGIAAPATIAEIEKSRGPYKIAAICERAAVAALNEDVEWVCARAADAIASRDALIASLTDRGVPTAPTSSNFVFAVVPRAMEVAREMRRLGIAVRALGGLPRFSPDLEASGGGALRITVGPEPEMTALLAALDEARRRCSGVLLESL